MPVIEYKTEKQRKMLEEKGLVGKPMGEQQEQEGTQAKLALPQLNRPQLPSLFQPWEEGATLEDGTPMLKSLIPYKTERQRRILARKGLAEWNDEEKKELTTWGRIGKSGYESIQRQLKQLQTNTYQDWSRDIDFRRGLAIKIREAEDYVKGLGDDSLTGEEANEYLAYLQELKKAYEERANYFGQFQDEKSWQEFEDVNELFRNANGRSYEEIYQGTVRNLENAKEKAEQAKKTRERIEDMRKELIEYQYYPSRGLTLNGMKNPTREEVQQRLQSLEQDAKLAEAEENMLRDQMARAQRMSDMAEQRRYADLPTRPDYEAQVEKGREAYEQKYGPLDPGTENELETAMKEVSKRVGNANMSLVALPATAVEVYKDLSYREPTGDWTQENLETFFYLYANNEENPEDAWAYASRLNDASRTKKLAEQTRSAEEWTNRSGWHRAAAWGAGVASAPFQLGDFAKSGMEYAFHGRISPHANATIADYANAMTGAASRFLNEEYGTLPEYLPVVGGKGWGDAYQLAQSIAQSALTAAAGGGVTNLLFFGSAANQGLSEAKARGATDGQALLFGTLCGAAEVLGETISVEHLISIKNPATLRQFLWNVLKQGGVEASEEAFTTLLTTFSDALVMGDKSELQQAIRKNRAAGMSQKEAEKAAWTEWANGIAFDALSGYFSGGISAGGRQAIGMIQANNRAYFGEDAKRLVELAMTKDKSSKAYQLAEKIQKKGAMSELEATQLSELLGGDVETLHKEMRTELAQEAQRRLQKEGVEEKEAARLAENMTRDLLGEEMNRRDRKAWQKDFSQEQVRRVASEMKQERRRENARRAIDAQLNLTMRKAFNASNLKISSEDMEILREGFVPGAQRMNAYVIAMRDGYRLGAAGMEFENAAASSTYAKKVMPVQFQHAWALGAKAAGKNIPAEIKASLPGEELGGAEKDAAVKLSGQAGSVHIRSLTRVDGELKAVVMSETGEQTVSLKELDFGDDSLGDLVQVLRGRSDAEAMWKAYKSGMGIGHFVRTWDTAKAYAQSTKTANVESVLKDSLLQGMDEETIRAAFAYGRSLKKQEKAKLVKKTEAETSSGAEGASSKAGNVARSPRAGMPVRGENKGGVSYDGGQAGDMKLKAVNRARLTQRQQAQIALVEMLGKKFGIRFVLYESERGKSGRFQGANGLYKAGVIYLDVNAGLYGRNMGQVAIVRTAAHELTHYIQDHAQEQYDELKAFLLDSLVEWKGKDLGQLAAQKLARDRTGKLTMAEALDEVVADGCEMMLQRSKVMEQLHQKPGLAQTVKEWLQKWSSSVKEAFQGVSEVHDEARTVAEMEAGKLEKLLELWDKGLITAAENAAKSPAKTGGETRYQARDELSYEGLPAEAFYTDERIYSYDFLTAQKPMKISSMPPIPHWSMTAKDIRDNARESAEKNLAKVGKKDGNTYAVKNTYTGREIQVGMGAIRHSLAADNRADLVIKSRIISISGDLVQNAIPINGLVKENPQADGTYAMLGIATSEDATFAAVITVDQFSNVTEMEPIDVAHAINGRIKREDWSSSKDQPFRDNSSRLPQSSEITIAQVLDVVNETYKGILSDDVLKHLDEERQTTGYYHGRVLFQEREDLPTDRELLMAAKAEGRNAEALTAYQKKVRSLEALERKLKRQQDALEAARSRQVVDNEGRPLDQKEQKQFNRTTVQAVQEQIRKTEASIARAEKALADMERNPQLRQETETALAAWREQNPHDAARAIREMQRERDSLQAYVKLLRQEAKLTTPENRKMLPSDIRRLAQSLVNEHGSEAAVDQIAERLQELGDFTVANMEGGGVGYYNRMVEQAKQIAKMIVDESYETVDDNREIREGIRNYLRKHTLAIGDVRGDIPDFDRWRKANMGTLRLGNEGMDIDQAYQDLRSEFGEAFFPADVMAHSDQLRQILNALDMVQPSYHQMFSQFESWQAAESLANEIIDRLLSGEVKERESMADRAFRQRMEQLEAKYARKDKARQKALEDAEDRAAWEARKRDEAEERRREERALRRQLVEERVHELRERSIERDRLYRGRIAIDRKVVALSKIMLENSGKRHVPDAWKTTIGEFLASIDTLTKRSGEGSRSFHLERIEALKTMVERQQAMNEGRDKTGQGEGPQVFLDMNPHLAELLDPFIKLARDSSTGTITVENLEVEQMKELEEVLTAIREAVDKADVMLAAAEKGETLSKTAGETIEHLESMGKGKTGGMIRRFLSWDNLTPVYFFKRFGPAGERVFRELQNGWGKLAFNAKQIIDFSNEAYTAKEARTWEQEVHEFKLVKRESDLGKRESLTKAAADGGPEAARAAEERNKETVKLSTAQLMGLYCLAKREQALGHILGGGIRIWDITAKKGTQEQAERYLVTMEDIAEMTNALTERQKAVADALQTYMNTVGSTWGNEVSQKRFGVDLFTEKNYYPIQTDPMSRNARTHDADGADLFHILNMGFTKNTVKNAKNGVVIHSIFDVFSNHMADMAKYNSMGLPMLDAMKWINYRDETDGSFTSTRKAMEAAYGKNAERYFLGLMQDLNGSYEGGRRGEDIASRMISFSKVASVGANLRVAALQPTSYVRALAVLDPKYLLMGDNPARIKQGMEEAQKYSGTAVWKSLGFFDMNINSNMRDLIKHTDGAAEKIREASMWGAEMGDKTTWGRLWNATKAEVRAKTGLSGEELMKATAARFDDVIYQTQVMDSTMTRSHLMRQKGAFAGMMTSFMSEPTLSYNLLLDAVSNWQQAKRSGKGVKAASSLAARAFITYAMSQIAASIVESIFSAMRDEDDYESLWEKWKQAEFGMDGNLVQDLVIHNKLPYVRDVVSIVQGFTNKRMDTEWVEDLTRAYKALKRDMENGEFRWGTAYAAMNALSTVTGLPISNAARDGVAIWNTFVVQSAPDWRLKNIKRGTVKPLASIKQAYQEGAISADEAIRYMIRDAEIESEEKARQKIRTWGLEDGEKTYDKLLGAVRSGTGEREARDELLQAGYDEDSVNSAVRSAVKEWYQGTADDRKPRISKEQAVSMLVNQGGLGRRDAEKRVNEWTSFVSSPEHLQFDQIQDAYLAGEITAERAAEMRSLYGGKSRSEAKAEVQKWRCEKETGVAYGELENAWLDGEISDQKAVEYQMTYGGKTKKEAETKLQEWRYAKDTGGDYDDVKQGFLEDSISREQAIEAMMKYGGQTRIDAEKDVRRWECEKDTGIRYDKLQEMFLGDEISGERAAELRHAYGGESAKDAQKTVDHWRCEKETGIRWDDIRNAYAGGQINELQVQDMLRKYGGYSEQDALSKALQFKFAGTDAEMQDISATAATKWYDRLEEQGIRAETWYQVWKTDSNTEGDKNSRGKTINGSKKKKMVAYIDGLNLSPAQKDALYLALDYAQSGLRETPWHK